MPPKIKFIGYWLALLLVVTACSPSATPVQPTSNPNLDWKVEVSKYEVKNNLQASQTVTQYNGAKTDVQTTQVPTSGDVFLIVNLTISKVGTGSATFDWSKLSVQDQRGAIYPRDPNDTFLEQYS